MHNAPQDRCHLHLFKHPPRNRFEKLPEGFTPFVYNTKYRPSAKAPKKGLSDEQQLDALMNEVKRNGYGTPRVICHGDTNR